MSYVHPLIIGKKKSGVRGTGRGTRQTRQTRLFAGEQYKDRPHMLRFVNLNNRSEGI